MKIKLRRFKKYLAEIQALKTQASELTSELEQSYYRREESISRIERRARASENERIERERQAESDRWYREDQLKRATSDLERAVSYGDDYAIKGTTAHLKPTVKGATLKDFGHRWIRLECDKCHTILTAENFD